MSTCPGNRCGSVECSVSGPLVLATSRRRSARSITPTPRGPARRPRSRPAPRTPANRLPSCSLHHGHGEVVHQRFKHGFHDRFSSKVVTSLRSNLHKRGTLGSPGPTADAGPYPSNPHRPLYPRIVLPWRVSRGSHDSIPAFHSRNSSPESVFKLIHIGRWSDIWWVRQ